MRSLFSATMVATLLFACGKSPEDQPSSSAAAASSGKAATETLSYTVSYLGAAQQGQATLTNGKATLRIKHLPLGQSGQMQIELASGSAKKYVGHLNVLKVSEKTATRRLTLSKASGGAAPVQTAAQQNQALKKRSAKYCGGGGGGDGFDGFDDGRFGNDGFDDGRFGNDGFDDGRFGNDGFDDPRRGNDGFNDDFGGKGGRGGRVSRDETPKLSNTPAAAKPAAQEGELILELVAPKS